MHFCIDFFINIMYNIHCNRKTIFLALHHSVRVPVPTRTYRKKRDGYTYIYYYTSFFTKDNGKHSNTSVLIGRLDKDDSSKLIPNDHYYEYFDHSNDAVDLPEIVFEGDYSIGYSIAVNQIFGDLGLDVILKNSFGLAAYDIMTVAAYSIKNGAVMSYIDDYTKYHYDINNLKVLTNQRVSDLFASITYQQRMDFFVNWISKCKANDCFVYDISSISTYSEGIEQAEFGYNRDHDDLKQINIGIFSSINSKLPVYYENYNGSLTDKINLIPVLKNAQAVGIEKAHIVMDGGFFDEKRIKELNSTGLTFTVGMPSTLDKSKELLEEHRNEIHLMKKNQLCFQLCKDV